MKNITVIGSGTMGNGIAHTFAQFGYTVSLMDVSEPALQKALQLQKQPQKELSLFEKIKLN